MNGSNADDLAPALIRTYTIDSTTIVAVFDESLDSTSAAYASHYKLEKLGTPFTASPVPPLFSEVILQFGSTLSINTSYQLTVANIADCAGNLIGIRNTALAAIPVQENTSISLLTKFYSIRHPMDMIISNCITAATKQSTSKNYI